MSEQGRHIWLCGFMGCGKSTVGPLLAALCGADFIDMDQAIEDGEGLRIPEIFSRYGEPRFRELEAAYVARLSAYPPAVIAAGGGTFVSQSNAEEAKRAGVIVFLDVPFETCYARIANSDRPIVRQSTKEVLLEIYEKRRILYRRHADFCFDALLPPQETARRLAQQLSFF